MQFAWPQVGVTRLALIVEDKNKMTMISSVVIALAIAWFLYWQVQGWLLSHRSGHYAPMISAAPRYVRWALGCLLARIFIGPVKIVGEENLSLCQGRVIIAPKHVIENDAVLVAKLARTMKIRFLIAINQTQGLRGAPLAWMGAISVGYDKTNPALSAANATKSAVTALTSESDSFLLVFPEGRLDKENILMREKFRSGVVRIAKACQNRDLQNDWHVLPVDIVYENNVANATSFQRRLARLGISRKLFGHTVFGATVTYAKPLAVRSLPDDESLATDTLFASLKQAREACSNN